MRVAIPTWEGKVSPVLDVARALLVLDIEGGVEQGRRVEVMGSTGVLARAGRLKTLSVDVLICGAVSGPLEMALVSSGIEVIPHVCGRVEDVYQAFLSCRLSDQAFLMPGCGVSHYRHTRGRRAGSGRQAKGGAR